MLEKVKNKKIINRRKLIFTIVFILVFAFGFGREEKAEAADELGHCFTNTEEVFNGSESSSFETIWEENNITETDCTTKCNQKIVENPAITTCRWKSTSASSLTAGKVIARSGNSCTFDQWASGAFINCLLLTILNIMVSMLQLATSLFEWIMAPENITSVIGNDVIYSAWGTVRDVLNVSFIMFLLFSAFATVFQVDKYSYKKTLLTLVIMALLVNFSFPISRFIIDVSNMMMYYFASALGIDAGKTVIGFADATNLPNIIYGGGIDKASTTALFTSVIFIFIFAVTVLTITVLFVIRTIALAILIIFSSLAFVGTAIPPLSSYASDWWKKLFSYAFFGPVMLFMIYIASTLMTALARSGLEPMKKIAAGQSSDPDFIASLSFFVIPIVILWLGLGVAQSMSIAGASMVVGKAQGFMKGAGKWTATAPWKATKMAAKQTGVPGAMKQRWDQYKKESFFGSEKQAQREAKRAAFLGVKGAEEKDMRRRAEEHKKNFTTDAELETLASGGDAAAAYRLAEDKKMKQDTYDKFVANAKDKTGSLKKAVNSKVKQNRNDLVAINKSNDPEELTKTSNVNGATAGGYGANVAQYIADQQMGTLSAEQWNDQNWTDIVMPLPPGPPPPTPVQIADRNRKILAAQTAWTALKPNAQEEVRKRLSSNNAAALTTIGIA